MAGITKTRVIYTEGEVDITGVITETVKTVQNATYTLTVPRENVNAFGFDGVLDRPQLDATDATLEFAFIPQISSSTTGDITGVDLGALRDDSILGTPAYSGVNAKGVGALTGALMNSIAIDAAVGAMPTLTMGMTGTDGGIPAKGTPAASSTMSGMALVEPNNIDVTDLQDDTSPGCAQSAAVAWDLPVELILCLGDDPATDGEAFGNPPGTASFTVEGLNDELPANTAAGNYTLAIGLFAFTLVNARIDSKTNSMAVGDLFTTFNYVLGGTADGMTIA